MQCGSRARNFQPTQPQVPHLSHAAQAGEGKDNQHAQHGHDDSAVPCCEPAGGAARQQLLHLHGQGCRCWSDGTLSSCKQRPGATLGSSLLHLQSVRSKRCMLQARRRATNSPPATHTLTAIVPVSASRQKSPHTFPKSSRMRQTSVNTCKQNRAAGRGETEQQGVGQQGSRTWATANWIPGSIEGSSCVQAKPATCGCWGFKLGRG